MNNFNFPKLSIFIATYNRSSKLKRVIEFVHMDALKNGIRDKIEIIISDNNSVDQTQNILKSFKEKNFINDFFKNNNNIGSDKNMLTACWRTKADFVWLLCDDDIPKDGAIGEILEIISKNNSKTSLIYLNNTKEYESGLLRRGAIYSKDNGGILEASKCIKLVKDELITASSLVFHREALHGETTRKFGYSGRFSAPLCIALDAISINRNAFITPEPLLRYIYGDTSEWSHHWYSIWIINIPMIFIWSSKNYGFDLNSYSPSELTREKAQAFLKMIINPRFWPINSLDWIWILLHIIKSKKSIYNIFKTFLITNLLGKIIKKFYS